MAKARPMQKIFSRNKSQPHRRPVANEPRVVYAEANLPAAAGQPSNSGGSLVGMPTP